MKNYDICKNINEFYFNSYAYQQLDIPNFFMPSSPEGQAVENIDKLVKDEKLDEALALAEECLQKFPPHTHNGFLTWQIYIYWKQGKIPNSELYSYLSTIEEIFHDDASINFDKSVILIKKNKFNEAVKNLESARKKIRTTYLQSFFFSGSTISRTMSSGMLYSK